MERTDHRPTQGAPHTREHPTQADESLRRVLDRPTLASQLITETAHQLTAHTPSEPITALSWSDAIRRAHTKVIAEKPAPVAHEIYLHATQGIPGPRHGETCGEYALRLHAAAKGL